MWVRRVLHEPLVHFLALGGLLFVAFACFSSDAEHREDEIVVTAAKVEQLANLFRRTWQRPPTDAELQGLIDDLIREEAAYREAMRLGLDRDDTVVRRRLRQKFEFMAEGAAAMVEPSDDDLEEYLRENPDAFCSDPRLSFRHVYLGSVEDEAGSEETRQLLALLRGDAALDASDLGVPSLLDHAFAGISERDIGELFGPRFAAAVVELSPGSWQGPVGSGYGAHLVIVDERQPGRVAELDEVRDRVRREWENERREAALRALYDQLVGRYRVTVERPGTEPTGGQP